MIELLRRIIRFAVVIVVGFLGLVMALILTFSTQGSLSSKDVTDVESRDIR
jgi:uncharacterized membrane protein YdfJ with MMPL/SSD domain